jgi:hypothetical protein
MDNYKVEVSNDIEQTSTMKLLLKSFFILCSSIIVKFQAHCKCKIFNIYLR